MAAIPIVSVIMSVYNNEHYLQSAIDSILNQTFQNFEFIIVDDASTDHTQDILQQYTDERIQIIYNKENLGLTQNLNKALKIARGKYIARMDGDDISLPERLEKQVNFLDGHEEIYLISCSYREFGSSFGKNLIQMPENIIKAQFIFGNVLPHPGFMFRKELVDKYHIVYNPKMIYAQDYDFQVRVSRQFHISCLPEILLYYRISSEQISVQKLQEQKAYADRVRFSVFKHYGIMCNREQIRIFSKIFYKDSSLTLSEIIVVLKLFLSIYMTIGRSKNEESRYINAKIRKYIVQLKECWFK